MRWRMLVHSRWSRSFAWIIAIPLSKAIFRACLLAAYSIFCLGFALSGHLHVTEIKYEYRAKLH